MQAAAMLLSTALLLLTGPAMAAAHDRRPRATAFPSGGSIPENLLRIELRFSRPWRDGLEMRFVRMLDGKGREIGGAFLDLPLPSADGRSVSLLLHPGRVKSGTGPNLALGRALHAGDIVTLVVDDPRLARPLHKRWRVDAASTRAPAPARWHLQLPAAGGRAALQVHLDAPIASSAEALIALRAPDGRRVAGTGRLLDGETTWRFVPARPWPPGTYSLVLHPELEDPAGNRVCRPFETPAGRAPDCAAGASRPFRIPAPTASTEGVLR